MRVAQAPLTHQEQAIFGNEFCFFRSNVKGVAKSVHMNRDVRWVESPTAGRGFESIPIAAGGQERRILSVGGMGRVARGSITKGVGDGLFLGRMQYIAVKISLVISPLILYE
jgi:hypothetical protein